MEIIFHFTWYVANMKHRTLPSADPNKSTKSKRHHPFVI